MKGLFGIVLVFYLLSHLSIPPSDFSKDDNGFVAPGGCEVVKADRGLLSWRTSLRERLSQLGRVSLSSVFAAAAAAAAASSCRSPTNASSMKPIEAGDGAAVCSEGPDTDTDAHSDYVDGSVDLGSDGDQSNDDYGIDDLFTTGWDVEITKKKKVRRTV